MTTTQVRNVTPVVDIPGGSRPAPVMYHGSLAEYRGVAQLVDECGCADCLDLDPWERRAKLRVLIAVGSDDEGSYWQELTHVRWGSFTSLRSDR